MPLDPQPRAHVARLATLEAPPRNAFSPEQVRADMAGELAASADPVALEPVAHVATRAISGPEGEIPVRIFTPTGNGPFPLVVYFHGGGWVLGTLAGYDSLCRSMANGARCIVVAVGYRLAPALKQAQSKGIKVVSYDSAVAPDTRSIFINQTSTEDIGRTEVQVLGAQLNYTGEIAILSATSTATNQNAWIDFMKQELSLPKYANMKLVKIAYGNDDDQTSYSQTQALVQAYPNLKGIISPTTGGIAAAARYLEANNLSGKIALTGLGTRVWADGV